MKRFHRIRHALQDRTSRLRRDVICLTLATVCLAAGFTALYGYISRPAADPAAIAARAAEEERIAALALQARRTGTILFVTFTKYCEEHRFDNQTGYTVGIEYVNCDERLARDNDALREIEKTKNVKGMLASFKK
ncbi:MAG: hypothetical protein Q8M24_07400 [Pseudolabrys sp.]|nr:hypothetical protein [Pseudolabrys sp.]MDP2295276.1 hypothetical protein [Pseudolabrys sp.]